MKNLLASAGLAGTLMFGASLPLAAAPARPAFDSLSEEELARVERGEIVVNVSKSSSAVKHFRVVGQINASAKRAYDVFIDFPSYAEIFHIKESRVVRQDGNVLHVRATIEAPWPFGDRWVINETRLEPSDYGFTFQRVEGSITEYNGHVRIVPKGPERSHVYYVAKADPGIPFLPAWLLNHFQASMLPDTIKHVREYLKRKGG